jgi:hypothetical protein
LKNNKPLDIYEVRPRKDHRGVDLISDVLPFGRLWYDTPRITESANAKRRRPSHAAVIRVYDDAGDVIETPEQPGEFKKKRAHLPPKVEWR